MSSSNNIMDADADANSDLDPNDLPMPLLFPSLEELSFERLPKLKGWWKVCRPGPSSKNTYYLGLLLVLEVILDKFQALSSFKSLWVCDCKRLKEIEKWIAPSLP